MSRGLQAGLLLLLGAAVFWAIRDRFSTPAAAPADANAGWTRPEDSLQVHPLPAKAPAVALRRLEPSRDSVPDLEQQYRKALADADVRHERAVSRVRAQFDEATQQLVLTREHTRNALLEKLDAEVKAIPYTLDSSSNDAQRAAVAAAYEKQWSDALEKYRSDMEKTTVQRQEAMARLDAERAQRQADLGRLDSLLTRGQIDAVSARQEQLRILGVTVSPSSLRPTERDPATSEASAAEAGLSGNRPPKVTSIFADGNNRLCIKVNNNPVYEGNMVGGYRVKRINPNSVVFEKDGRTWVYGVP